MSKSVESTRRELFEAWYFTKVQKPCGLEDNPEGLKLRRGVDGNYSEYPAIKHKWHGFNAALDCVEIELPSKYKTEEGYSMYDVAEVITCIHNTNLGLKIK